MSGGATHENYPERGERSVGGTGVGGGCHLKRFLRFHYLR
jgi:hypothetical protein